MSIMSLHKNPWSSLTPRSCRPCARLNSRKCSAVCWCRSCCEMISLATRWSHHQMLMTCSWGTSMALKALKRRRIKLARSSNVSNCCMPNENDSLTSWEKMRGKISQSQTSSSKTRTNLSANRSLSSHRYGEISSSPRNTSFSFLSVLTHPQIVSTSNNSPS